MSHRHLLFLFLLATTQLHAQLLEPKNFVAYTTANGLSPGTITGLTQDATGYLWIATLSSLNRFNGREFVQFRSSSDSLSLASDDITGLTWLNQNLLAVYNAGLHIINTKTGERRNLFIPYHRKQLQYKFNMIAHARGDAEGNVYVLTRSGFYHFNKEYDLVFRFDYYNESEANTEHFVFGNALFQLDDHRLLITSVDGLYLYDKAKRKIKKMTSEDCPLLAEFFEQTHALYLFHQHKPGHFIVLKTNSDSLVYVNTAENKNTVSRLPFRPIGNVFRWRTQLVPVNDTLFYLTGQHSGFYAMQLNPRNGSVRVGSNPFFSNYLCHTVLHDKDNSLWVATNKGLFRQDGGRSQVQLTDMPDHYEKASPNIVYDVAFAAGDKLYAGTRNPGSLMMYDKKNLRFLRQIPFHAYTEKTLQTFNVYAIGEAGPNHLLLAVDGRPLLVNKALTKSSLLYLSGWGDGDWAGDLFRDSRGDIWLSAFNVGRYHPTRGFYSPLPKEVMQASNIRHPAVIREDAAGNMWLAGHGLSRYNTSLQRFDLHLDSFPFIKMPDKQVGTMLIDKQRNTIWFGSHNNGLLSYDIAQRRFRHFTTSNGLPSNNMAALILVEDKLWMAGAYSGVACLDLQNFQITSFGRADGLPEMPVLTQASFFYDSAAHQLYLAFAKSIVRFRPDQLLHKKNPPRVFIESLITGNQKPVFLPANHTTISWKDAQLRITIGAINFSDAMSQRFAYRILAKGEERPWTDLGSQPSFSVSGLSPGVHRVQVKVYSVNNRWPVQVSEMTVMVLPPLWLKPWFLVLAGILVIAVLYAFVKWRIRQVRKKEMKNTYTEKLKADYYKNQFELEQITNYFSTSLSGKKTTNEVLWDVTKNLIGRMNYEDCVIYLWNETKTKMVQKAAYGPKGLPEVISTSTFEVEPGQGIVGHVVQTRQPILVNDTRKDERYRVDDAFRLSEVTVPIIHNNELLGVIDSEHSQPSYFSEQDVKILTTIATLLGNKLKQLESEQFLEAKQMELFNINGQLAEARLSALQAQMNPHFVFNALNSIKRMILDGDNPLASRYLSKFAFMIRMTLEHSKELFVSLDDNIEYLKAYLDMEQLRFGESFTYDIAIDDSVDTAETLLPSMMLQPLVENAIWHGLAPSEKAKHLRISFNKREDKVICSVEDNGIGIQQSGRLRNGQRPLHRSIGLENLQRRIRIINEKYGTDCSLVLTDLSELLPGAKGTRAVLQFITITTNKQYESNFSG